MFKFTEDAKIFISRVSSGFTIDNTYRLAILHESLDIDKEISLALANSIRLGGGKASAIAFIDDEGEVGISFSTYIRQNDDPQDKLLWESLLGRQTILGNAPQDENFSTLSRSIPPTTNIIIDLGSTAFLFSGCIVASLEITFDLENFVVAKWKLLAISMLVTNDIPIAYSNTILNTEYCASKKTQLNIDFNNTIYTPNLIKGSIKLDSNTVIHNTDQLGKISTVSSFSYGSLQVSAKFTFYLNDYIKSFKDDIESNLNILGICNLNVENYSIVLNNVAILQDKINISNAWTYSVQFNVVGIPELVTLNQSVRLSNYKFKTIVNPNKYFKPKAWDVSMDWYTKIPVVIEEQPEPPPPPDWYLTSELYNFEVAEAVITQIPIILSIRSYEGKYADTGVIGKAGKGISVTHVYSHISGRTDQDITTTIDNETTLIGKAGEGISVTHVYSHISGRTDQDITTTIDNETTLIGKAGEGISITHVYSHISGRTDVTLEPADDIVIIGKAGEGIVVTHIYSHIGP